ncbi:HutD family protein [Streptomyces sp. NPDC048484]|uniref:HutD/Ves family protein n=1 Tax=Streptomyces sp. NPDC048484 TaxID=3155146 RepID=UPI00342AE2B7
MLTPEPRAGESGIGYADATRVIRMTTLEPQRWANGRGWTREIHRELAADQPRTTTWRLSLADIEETGPFSALPEMDRHLLSAAPVPLQLSIDGVVHDLRYTQVVRFAGASQVAATAVQGRAQALNLMTRRGIRGGVDLLSGDAQLPVSATSATALVVLDGTVSLGGRQLERFDTVLPGSDETLLDLRKATVARVRVATPAAHTSAPAGPGRPLADTRSDDYSS